MGKTVPRRTQHNHRYNGIDTRAAGLAGGGGGGGGKEERGASSSSWGRAVAARGHAVGWDFVGKFLFFFDDGGRPANIL